MSFYRRQIQRLRSLWQAAKNERASPRQIAWALGIGVFAGCTPAVGLHGWLAVGLATLFRLNRLFAFLGSRISFFLIFPWIVIAEVELSHVLRTGEWVAIDRKTAVEQAGEMLLDWCIGCVPIGALLAVAIGAAGYAWALRRQQRRATSAPPGAEPEKPAP